MLRGDLPFPGETPRLKELAIKRADLSPLRNDPKWRPASKTCKALLCRLLTIADFRFSAREALDHPWLKKGDPDYEDALECRDFASTTAARAAAAA